VGDGGVTLGKRGEEVGDERGDDEVEPSGTEVAWSRPKDDMSSTNEGSVVILKIKQRKGGYNVRRRRP
jgi:hypothetical protein